MYTARELTCKRARNVLTQRKFKEPLASSRLRRLGVDETTINAITNYHSKQHVKRN